MLSRLNIYVFLNTASRRSIWTSEEYAPFHLMFSFSRLLQHSTQYSWYRSLPYIVFFLRNELHFNRDSITIIIFKVLHLSQHTRLSVYACLSWSVYLNSFNLTQNAIVVQCGYDECWAREKKSRPRNLPFKMRFYRKAELHNEGTDARIEIKKLRQTQCHWLILFP